MLPLEVTLNQHSECIGRPQQHTIRPTTPCQDCTVALPHCVNILKIQSFQARSYQYSLELSCYFVGKSGDANARSTCTVMAVLQATTISSVSFHQQQNLPCLAHHGRRSITGTTVPPKAAA
jgi:hypothetical protein